MTQFRFNRVCHFSWTEVKREDKRYFTSQVVVAQDNLYNKKIPTWASNFDLLTKVVQL